SSGNNKKIHRSRDCAATACFITSVHGGAFPLNMDPCHVHQLIAASRGIKPSRIQPHASGEWVCEGPVSSRTARTASTYYSGPCISQGGAAGAGTLMFHR